MRESTTPRSRIRRRDRGAVLVEAAIAIPILLLVILGALEAGMAWDAKSGTTNAMRSGLLRAASIADKPETDLRILQSIVGEIGADNVGQIEWVVVFDADANGGNHVDSVNQCASTVAGGGGGLAGPDPRCVAYDGATLAGVAANTIDATFFDDGSNALGNVYTCDSTKLDANFCAPSRTVNGDMQVGVALQYRHDWITGILPFDAPLMREMAVSSTFVGDGADINGNTTFNSTPTTSYDSGGFDGSLNSPNINWAGMDDSDINTAPNGETFLGPFGQGDVASVTVSDLPAHTQVCYSFDLYIIGSWDGNSTTYGPDSFRVDVGSDGTYEHDEIYGGNGGTDTLGYNGSGELDANWGSRVVPVQGCVDYPGGVGSSVTLDFSAILSNANISNEGWGIDNLEISTNFD